MRNEENTHIVVRETVLETLRGIGFNVNEPHEIQADLIYLSKMRKGSDDIRRIIRRSAISVLIPTLLYILWESFKHKITGQ